MNITAREVSRKLGRRIARAAVIRATVHLLLDKMAMVDVPGLKGLFDLDTVRRGRAARKGGAS